MKKTLALVALLAVAILTGCTSPTEATESTPSATVTLSPYETAWATCVEQNGIVYPDGLLDADGRTWTPDEVCHSTVAKQGQAEFTDFYNDESRWSVYIDALKAMHEAGLHSTDSRS